VVSFNVEVWRSRALARYRRTAATGRPDPDEGYQRDLIAIDGLARVIGWCEGKQHEVIFDSRYGAEYDGSTRRFRVNGRAKPETQLYLLLHECGHYLIGYPQRGERFSEGYSSHAIPGGKRRLIYRIDVLDEELEAWHRGRRLGARLGAKIDKAAFDKLRTECIKNYAKWAVKVDGYGEIDGET
jgi:hypothetical protein